MIEVSEQHGVTRIHMWSRRSRLVGYTVSAFVFDGVLIDCGFPAVRLDLARALDELPVRGAIITHHHEDHAGNLALLAARAIPVAMPAETLASARAGERVGLYRRFAWGTMRRLARPLEPFHTGQLALLHTPGHSADHHVVWDAERGILFSADLFLGVKVRVARPGEDPRQLALSLRRAADLRPRLMFDAHRGLVPDGATALLAKARWLDETIGRIDTHIAAGWSDRAITRAVLGREDGVHYVSSGDLSRINFVKAVRRSAVREMAAARLAGAARR